MSDYIKRLLILDSLNIEIDKDVKEVYDFLENTDYILESYDEPYDKVIYYVISDHFVDFVVTTYMYMKPELTVTPDFYDRFNLDNKLIYSIVKYFLKKKYDNIDHIKYMS